jgi:DNA-binding transcriptional LysR family regulator
MYGGALLKCGSAVFDELRLGIRHIEFLSDPTAGELRIGGPESLASGILPQIIERFFRQYPGVVLDVDAGITETMMQRLAERGLDLVLARTPRAASAKHFGDHLNVEILFDDELIVAAGMHTRWARRRTIDLGELINERWILTGPDIWNYEGVAAACRARGLDMPKISMKTLSVHLRTNLLATGEFITALPKSVLRLYGERLLLKALPVDLPVRPWPVAILTLKNRTLNPVVERFIECARDVAKSFSRQPTGRSARSPKSNVS